MAPMISIGTINQKLMRPKTKSETIEWKTTCNKPFHKRAKNNEKLEEI